MLPPVGWLPRGDTEDVQVPGSIRSTNEQQLEVLRDVALLSCFTATIRDITTLTHYVVTSFRVV